MYNAGAVLGVNSDAICYEEFTVSAVRQMLSFGLWCCNTTPTLSEIQIKLLFYPKQYMVQTICSQDKMHISLTSFRFHKMRGIS
jgi:hypothetical protein